MIVYVSMWGSTEKMALALRDALVKRDITVQLFDIPNTEIGHIAKELVDTPVIVLGAPTVLGGAHPVAAYATMLVRALRAPTKYAAVLTSYGWGGGAVKTLQGVLEGTKIEMLGVVEVKGPPKKVEFDKILELADTISEKLKQL
jgi:flavorubredoxin